MGCRWIKSLQLCKLIKCHTFVHGRLRPCNQAEYRMLVIVFSKLGIEN